MENQEIPIDDMQDIIELGEEIESKINEILEENDIEISMSALICSTINTIVNQCETKEEMKFYKKCFNEIFAMHIKRY